MSQSHSRALPPAVGIHFYRIAQEAAVNAAKHAKAHHVLLLSPSATAGQVKLTIEDDGGGMGLRAPQCGRHWCCSSWSIELA